MMQKELKTYYSIPDLLSMRIKGVPQNRQGLEYRAKRERWLYREVKATGGKKGTRREYQIPVYLQDLIRQQILDEQVHAVVCKQVIADISVTNANEMTAIGLSTTALMDWQRSCAEARLAIVREVEYLMVNGMGRTSAIESLVTHAANNQLRPELQQLVAVANAKAGQSRKLSIRSVFDWCGSVRKAQDSRTSPLAALAPKAKISKIPAWGAPLLKLWSQPQKPNLTSVLHILPQYLPAQIACPSYAQARRFLQEQVGHVDRERGRSGSRKLKAIQPFMRRDTTILQPTDCYTMDGHTFDAEVAHPIHGRPFRPEITAVIDVATRRLVGYSIDLAESGWAVLDAIRMAACDCGIPALLYVDNGAGYCNALMKAEGTGLMARLGTQMTHSLPYNSQARGLIERSHQTIWVKAAKKLPTFIGSDMDDQARQKVFKVVRSDIKKAGKSLGLISWERFLDFAKHEAEAYNHQPHRGLPKIRDDQTGKLRHLTPIEAWESARHDGWQPEHVLELEKEDLFRPYVVRKINRGEINLFSNRYFARELEQYHGDELAIGYDIHNSEKVWVRDDDGRLICIATINANQTSYFPKSVIEQAREKRAAGRMRAVAAKQSEIIAELGTGRVIEHIEQQTTLPAHFRAPDQALAELNQSKKTVASMSMSIVPFPRQRAVENLTESGIDTKRDLDESPLQRWLRLDEVMQSTGDIASPAERMFWERFPQSKKFKLLLEENEELRLRQQRQLG